MIPPDGLAHVEVTQLNTTPIKGFRLRHPPSITLTAEGVVGDRDFLFVDQNNQTHSVTRSGVFLQYWARFDPDTDTLSIGRDDRTRLSSRVERGKFVRAHLFGERYVAGHYVEGPWNAYFSELAGISLRLVRVSAPSSGYDLHPVTLLSESSVAALEPSASNPTLDTRVFRLLITCRGPDPFAEESWEGARIRLGSAEIVIGGPVPRCAAVQRHPDEPDVRLDTLHRLAAIRGPRPSELGRRLNLGVYAEILKSGTVSVGDRLIPV